jgi:hypothetical protein
METRIPKFLNNDSGLVHIFLDVEFVATALFTQPGKLRLELGDNAVDQTLVAEQGL